MAQGFLWSNFVDLASAGFVIVGTLTLVLSAVYGVVNALLEPKKVEDEYHLVWFWVPIALDLFIFAAILNAVFDTRAMELWLLAVLVGVRAVLRWKK